MLKLAFLVVEAHRHEELVAFREAFIPPFVDISLERRFRFFDLRPHRAVELGEADFVVFVGVGHAVGLGRRQAAGVLLLRRERVGAGFGPMARRINLRLRSKGGEWQQQEANEQRANQHQ